MEFILFCMGVCFIFVFGALMASLVDRLEHGDWLHKRLLAERKKTKG